MQIPDSHFEEANVLDLHAHAQREEQWHQDVREFRQRFFALGGQYFNNTGLGWAIFDTTADDQSLRVAQSDLLLTSQPAELADGPAQLIHVISNELITARGIHQYLVKDFMLDQFGRARMFVDATVVHARGDHQQPFVRPAHAPLYNVAGTGDLESNTPINVLPVIPMRHDEGFVIPFGDDRCYVDKRDALNMGKTMLAAAIGKEPMFCTPGTAL